MPSLEALLSLPLSPQWVVCRFSRSEEHGNGLMLDLRHFLLKSCYPTGWSSNPRPGMNLKPPGGFWKPSSHSDPSQVLGHFCLVFFVCSKIHTNKVGHFNHFKAYIPAGLSSVLQLAFLPGSRIFHHSTAVTPLPVSWVCVPCILPIRGLTAHACLPFPRFLKGLPVRPALLSDELKAALDMDPTPGVIKYIIATQVRPGTSPQPQGPAAPAVQHTWGGPHPAHRP